MWYVDPSAQIVGECDPMRRGSMDVSMGLHVHPAAGLVEEHKIISIDFGWFALEALWRPDQVGWCI